MDKSKIVGNALEVAKAAAPLVVGPAGIALGVAVLGMIRGLDEVVGATPEKIKEFEETREQFERAVNERANATIDALGDRSV